MRNAGPERAWSFRFKRQIALIALIAVSPAMTFLGHASDVPRGTTLAFAISALAISAALFWYYFFRSRPSPAEAPMSERETWIAVAALVALATLLAFNAYRGF